MAFSGHVVYVVLCGDALLLDLPRGRMGNAILSTVKVDYETVCVDAVVWV